MYSYTLYINPLHELITFEIPDFFKGVNFMIIESSMFGSLEEASTSLETLIKEKQSCLKLKQEIYVLRESNPMHMMSEDKFNEQYESNEDFQLYVDTWDETASLADFLQDCLLNLDEDEILVGIEFDAELYGMEIEPIELLGDILDAAEQQGKVLEVDDLPALINYRLEWERWAAGQSRLN